MLATAGAQPLGGGTDLLVCVDEGIVSPDRVVDLRGIAGSDRIAPEPDGSLRIGASARLHDVSRHALVRSHCASLADACGSVGTPALRHMGTLGGNLCQRPRCWYFRRGISCLKNGGDACPARDGENQYHAILEGGPCWIVHPSDAAVALAALGASIEVSGGSGARRVAVEKFFVLPSEQLDRETALAQGEVVSAVIVPGPAPDREFHRKLMQRGAWDFALASIVAVRRGDDVRIALGGVAPRPWMVPASVVEDVASGGLDEESISALAERALHDAVPLSKNGYKVQLAASLLRDAIRAVSR